MSEQYQVTGPWPNDEQPWHISIEREAEGHPYFTDLYYTTERADADEVCARWNRGEGGPVTG